MLLSRLSFACCLGLLYLILGSRTAVSACVTFTLSSVSVLQIHSHSVAVIAVHLMLWEEQQQVQVFASFPRGRSAAHRAAGSGCPQGSRLSAVIGLCRSLWRPLAAAAEVADSSASKSVCLRTRRSAPGQVCGLALLARLTCPHLDGRPPTAVGRVSSLRGVAQYLVPRKNPTGIFGDNIIYIYIYICMYLCMYVCMYVCIHYLAMTVITPRLPALALYRKPSLY